MIYSAAAALSGPYLLIKLRQMSELKAIHEIVEKVSLICSAHLIFVLGFS